MLAGLPSGRGQEHRRTRSRTGQAGTVSSAIALYISPQGYIALKLLKQAGDQRADVCGVQFRGSQARKRCLRFFVLQTSIFRLSTNDLFNLILQASIQPHFAISSAITCTSLYQNHTSSTSSPPCTGRNVVSGDHPCHVFPHEGRETSHRASQQAQHTHTSTSLAVAVG